MIAWLVKRREIALENWANQRRAAVWMQGTPMGIDALIKTIRARRVLRFWDALLDVATFGARRREAKRE